MQKFGAVLEVKDEFSSSISKFNSEVGAAGKVADQGTKKAGGFGAGLKKAGKMAAVGAAAVGAAGVAAGGAMLAMGNKFAGTADEIDKTSMKMGVSTDTLQELRFAMGQVGVEQSTLDKAMQRTNQRIGEAAAGNEKYQDALTELGFSMDEVKSGALGTDEVFMGAIDTLNGMESSTEAAALAGELFGKKTAQDLMPAIEAGTLSIEDLRNEAHELGGVISEDGVKAGVLWSDTMDKAKTALSGLGNSIASKTLPVLQNMMDVVLNNMPAITEKFDSLANVAGSVFTWLGEVGTSVFTSIKNKIQENMPTLIAIKDTAVQVGEGLQSAFEAAKPTLIWLKDEALPAAADAVFFLLDKAIALKDYIVNNWSVIGPLVTGIVVAFGTWKAAVIAQTAVTATLTGAQKALGVVMRMNPIGMVVTAIGLLIGAGILLYKNWDTVSAKAGELWGSIKTFFGNIKDWAIEVWDGVKEKIGSAMDSAGTAVSNFFSPLMDFIASAKETWDTFTGALSNFSMPKAVSSAISAVGGVAGKIGGFISGSHADGLSRVPHDGYVAELHKDEAVLTAREADTYRKRGLDAFTQPRTMKNPASYTTNNNKSNSVTKNENKFDINVNARDKTALEIMNELVPQIKQRLANM